MLKIIILISSLLPTWTTTTIADDDFYLKKDLLTREVSKDSNSQRYTLEVKNNEVKYQYNYRGSPDNADKGSSRILTDKELSEIIQFIKKIGIDKSITEITSIKANGPSRKLHLSLELKLDGQRIESKISGNSKIFRADGRINGAIIQNKAYVSAVMFLIQKLNGFVIKSKLGPTINKKERY